MKTKTKILGIDPGMSSDPLGWYFQDGEYTEKGLLKLQPKDKMLQTHNLMSELFSLYKPEVVLVCKPAGRFGNIIFSQGKQCGVIQRYCEVMGVKFIDKHDSHYRLALPKGKKTKAGVQEFFNEENHISDARMAVYWYLSQ